MVVEDTLQLVGGLLDVLLPLSLEELEALARDDLRMLLLEVTHGRHALVEGRISDLACNCNFDRRGVHSSRDHLKF